MSLTNWLITNRELVKLIFTMLIVLICFIIVLKTNKFFKLSSYSGLRYFRNAFLFFGIAFIFRYLLGLEYKFNVNSATIFNFLFNYFILIAGFFLLYSLLWRRLERYEHSQSSVFNVITTIFYILGFIVVALDFLWGAYYFLFSMQILIFIIAGIILFFNYKKRRKFSWLYFIAIFLNLAAWVINFIVTGFYNGDRIGIMWVYIINAVIFSILLYAVLKVGRE